MSAQEMPLLLPDVYRSCRYLANSLRPWQTLPLPPGPRPIGAAQVHLEPMTHAQRHTSRVNPQLVGPQAVAMPNESDSSAIALPCCV